MYTTIRNSFIKIRVNSRNHWYSRYCWTFEDTRNYFVLYIILTYLVQEHISVDSETNLNHNPKKYLNNKKGIAHQSKNWII